MHPRAHSPLLLSSLRGQADQENRSPVSLRAWPRGPLRGGFHSSQGGLSSLKVLRACPCPSSRCPPCLLSCLHSHLQYLTCCQHALEAQEQVARTREMPPGPQRHSGGPGQCCCSCRRGVPLLPLFCPSGFSPELPCCWQSPGDSGSHGC